MADDRRFRRLDARVEGRHHPLITAPLGAVAGACVGVGAVAWEGAYLAVTGERMPVDPTVPLGGAAAIGAGLGFVAGLGGLWGPSWAVAFGTCLTASFVGVPLGLVLASAGAPAGVGVGFALLAGAVLCQLAGRLPMPPMLQGSAGWFVILAALFAASAHHHVLPGLGGALPIATLALGAVVLAPFAVVLAALGRIGRGAWLPAGVKAASGLGLLRLIAGGGAAPLPQGDGPDIVVIVVQGLRADHLDGAHMPRLTAATRGARRYVDASSTSSWSVPAMGSLLTGLAPYRHHAGVRVAGVPSERGLRPDVHGWPSRLRWAGYAPQAVVGDPGLQPFALDTGFARYDDTPPGGPVPTLWLPWVVAGVDRGALALRIPAEQVTDRALQALEGEAGGRALLVVYADAGGPFDGVPEARTSRTPAVDAYEASLGAVDAAVARLVEGLPPATAWLLMGDRGVRLEETRGKGHLWGQHLMPELVNIPLLMRVPGQGGGTVRTPVSIADVAPTVLDLAGLDVPDGLDGVSLRREVPAGRILRAEATRYGVDAVSARRGRYRLVRLGGVEAFYDLQGDPHMLEPLGQDPSLEQDRRELRAALPPDVAHTQPPSLALQLGRLFARLAVP